MPRTRHDRASGTPLDQHITLLQAAGAALEQAEAARRTAREARDAAIRQALAAGLSLRQAGGALGLSAQGVATIAAGGPVYDQIGPTYATTRQPDPRIRDQIWAALAGARSVVNVGAGAGSYEPPETLLAVEPSLVMISQRPPGAAPAAVTTAERIPLPDGAVDAALCVLTIHHWPDLEAGLQEIRRVARRVVILTWDFDVSRRFWLLEEYFPAMVAADAEVAVPIDRLAALLPGATVAPVPVPHDCVDGFLGAFWRRPEAYLDARVRAGISAFARVAAPVLEAGLTALAADLDSGRWGERHADLLELDEFDAGYRLVAADFGPVA